MGGTGVGGMKASPVPTPSRRGQARLLQRQGRRNHGYVRCRRGFRPPSSEATTPTSPEDVVGRDTPGPPRLRPEPATIGAPAARRFALRSKLPDPEPWASCSGVEAPGLRPRGFLPCARGCRTPQSGLFAPAPALPDSGRGAFCLALEAAGPRSRGVSPWCRSGRVRGDGEATRCLTPSSAAPVRRPGAPAAGA